MPELPEVETITRGLRQLIIGRTIKNVVCRDSPKSFPNAPTDVAQQVVGAAVVAVRRRAKVLLIDLSTNYTLVIHLKMTGQLVYIKQKLKPEARFGGGHPTDSLIGTLPDKSTRVVIAFQDESHLYFNDQRKFGWIKLYPTAQVSQLEFMQKLGPEPLTPQLTATDFITRIRRRNNSSVKAAILDQTVLAGVGNIYADESLWAARIHPAQKVCSVSDETLALLLHEIKSVMQLSITKGGSTDKNYVNAEGKKGSYIDFARVFRKEGHPCVRHPDVLVQKTRVAGRGTHICPVCQPMAT
ncbi:MAG: bifunctional DNA-formamidopyrimidine glycosylase/DNA-(apurinic or apyrimidinic site) lyase [Candidatus Saccharimonas sp.]